MRVSSYAQLASNQGSYQDFEQIESTVESIVQGATIDLDLWLEEWRILTGSQSHLLNDNDISVTLLNLQIQHAWALMMLHLRALSTTGIENIAAMTESQQALIQAAKDVGERHPQPSAHKNEHRFH